ncbi:MAG: ATP-binding protein [Acidobacteria bacterium]|nr:ATP-binding protein [Acidobacteriota bacterium]
MISGAIPPSPQDSWPAKHSTVVIASNLNFGEWANVFDDTKMTTARLHWFTHHRRILETGNESVRFKSSSAQKPKSKTEKASS